MTASEPRQRRITGTAALQIATVVLVLDQASKYWVREVVLGEPAFLTLTPFFNLVWVWNTGVSFGMFNNSSAYGPWLLSALALAVTGALVYWARGTAEAAVRVPVALIAAGAVGNVIDRVLFGAVFDFVDLHVAGYHWPAFNVADSAITIGAALLVVDALFPSLFSGKD
jgi:signal peptidase II